MISKKVTGKIILLLLFLAVLLQGVMALLPPSVYAERVEKSAIKAIALVQEVELLGHQRGVDTKKVSFKLLKSFGKVKPPEIFIGECKSLNKKKFGGHPPVDGTLYYRPEKGAKVYVTIAKKGGTITSYTPLTPKLEKALMTNFKSVKSGLGVVYVSEGKEK